MHREAGLPQPLDPLTADEIRRAAIVLEGNELGVAMEDATRAGAR
jgi:Cu2+-containing amine oxidase